MFFHQKKASAIEAFFDWYIYYPFTDPTNAPLTKYF
jgi:hypothetical protein